MKTIFGIFAHPDDEAFGPSGTIATLAKENEVYLICVTNGDAAEGHPNPELGNIRQEELRSSAKILGVKDVFFLNFLDGELSNNLYHDVAKEIQKILEEKKPELLITVEPRGVSGHIDHIFVSMVTSYVFEKLDFVKEIWYHAISTDHRALFGPYFIYLPPGYPKEQIDKTVDVSAVWDQKMEAMQQHKSQIKDVNSVSRMVQQVPKEEYFLIRKK